MRIFKKPGYLIVAIIILFIIYKLFIDDSSYREELSTEVNTILTDIKHQNYFSLQERLTPNAKKTVSIEDIEKFCKDIHLNENFKFILKKYNKKDKLVNISGNIIIQNKKTPLGLTLIENNSTKFIKSFKIGTKELNSKKINFPLTVNKFNSNSALVQKHQN